MSLRHLMRGATLATVITAGLGTAAMAQNAPETATAGPKASQDADRCLPPMSVKALDAIIADNTTKAAPYLERLAAIDAKGTPIGEELNQVMQSLQTADQTQGPALQEKARALHAQIEAIVKDRTAVQQEAEPVLKPLLLAQLEKGVITYSGWPEIEARGATVGNKFNGVCLGLGNTPVSVSNKNGLFTLDIKAGVMRQMPMTLPDGRMIGMSMTTVPIPKDQLLNNMPNLISQAIFYGSRGIVSAAGENDFDQSYDVESLALLSTVAQSMAIAEQVMQAVEKSLNGTDPEGKAAEIAYREFEPWQGPIADFELLAMEKVENGVIPADVRAKFRQDLVAFSLSDPEVRKIMIQSAAQQMAQIMSSGFRPMQGGLALVNPGPVFFVAEKMYTTPLAPEELARMLAPYGVDAAKLAGDYSQWKQREDDPGKEAFAAMEQIREQARGAVAKFTQEMERRQQPRQGGPALAPG